MNLSLLTMILFGYSLINYFNLNTTLLNIIFNYDNLDSYSQFIIISIILTVVIILLVFINTNKDKINITTLIYTILMIIFCCCFDKYKYFAFKILDNYDEYANINDRPPSPGCGEFNFIDTGSFNNYWLSLINKIHSLDIDSQIISFSVIIIIACLIYIIYIFLFIVSPLLFDAIKDYLPLKIKNFMIKYIKINRALNVPFVIISFLFTVFGLLLVIFILITMVYLNYLNPFY